THGRHADADHRARSGRPGARCRVPQRGRGDLRHQHADDGGRDRWLTRFSSRSTAVASPRCGSPATCPGRPSPRSGPRPGGAEMSRLSMLAGIRVVSMEQFIAGPYCSSLLSDAGAEVIKVERPGTGEPRRTYQPRLGPEDDYVSGGFASYNRGKRSVEIDLRTDEGREAMLSLLSEADGFLCNHRPGALERREIGRAPCR